VLKKEFRNITRKEIGEFKERGIMYKSPLFGLVTLDSEIPKMGVVISKKVSTKAVERNRIKRIIYEMVKANWEEWVKKHKKGLFLVRGTIIDKSYEEIKSEWQRLLKQF